MMAMIMEHNIDLTAAPSSPSTKMRLSSPQTPTTLRHRQTSDFVSSDYVPSQTILAGSEDEYLTEDDLLVPEPMRSGRSSISSLPASVMHHDVRARHTYSQDGPHTPSRSRAGTPTSLFQDHKMMSPLSTKDHLTGFRNPSSVRALQMRDEFSDSEDFTPRHRRRGSRLSYMSYRSGSTHSTPGKRMSRSLQGSPVKGSRLRKEFPLVLLHCSILPSLISPKARAVNAELLEAIIPEPYKKRWKLLREKILNNFELRDRGLLIPHPKEDYDLLEDRLLESLELEQPVVSHGHFIGRSDSRASTADSGLGSDENSSHGDISDQNEVEDDEEEERAKCADCGGQVCGDKRWEVKVFAANGLMRAGAWSAAWSEMEKVDVQVSVWLPEDVRVEIETRLDAVLMQEQQLKEEELHGRIHAKEVEQQQQEDERTREIYGDKSAHKKQEQNDGLTDHDQGKEKKATSVPPFLPSRTHQDKTDLRHAFFTYIKLLAQDRRNIVIAILGLLIAVIVLPLRQSPRLYKENLEPISSHLTETKTQYLTTTVVSTSLSVSTQTSTIAVPAEIATTVSFDAATEVATVLTPLAFPTNAADPATCDGSGLTSIPLLQSDPEEKETARPDTKISVESDEKIKEMKEEMSRTKDTNNEAIVMNCDNVS